MTHMKGLLLLDIRLKKEFDEKHGQAGYSYDGSTISNLDGENRQFILENGLPFSSLIVAFLICNILKCKIR